jgi:hypothetical protein
MTISPRVAIIMGGSQTNINSLSNTIKELLPTNIRGNNYERTKKLGICSAGGHLHLVIISTEWKVPHKKGLGSP